MRRYPTIVLFLALAALSAQCGEERANTPPAPAGVEGGAAWGKAGQVGPTGSKAPELPPLVKDEGLKLIELAAPGALAESRARYVLTKDLAVPGTAFTVGAGVKETILDLNGHTVTYNVEKAQEDPAKPYGHCVYGVSIGGRGTESIVIRNGSLIQGAGGNSGCHAVCIQGGKAIEVCNTQSRVHGKSCSNVSVVWGGPDGRIHDNYMENHSLDIAPGLFSSCGISVSQSGKNWEIYNNTIIGGHDGISAGANAVEDHRVEYGIHHNLIRNVRICGTKSPQGIICFGSAGHRIFENVISTDEGRGINIQARGSGQCDVHNNLIACRYSTEAKEGNYVENRCYGYWERDAGGNRVHGNIFIVDNEIVGDRTSSVVGIVATTTAETVRLPSAEFSNNRVLCHHKDPAAQVLGFEVKRSDKDVVVRRNEVLARTAAVDLDPLCRGVLIEENAFIRPPDAAGWSAVTGESAARCRVEKNSTVGLAADREAPAAPRGLRVIPRREAVELRWEMSPEPDVRGYHVYRDGQRLDKFLCGGSFYVETGLAAGAKHSYAVSAMDLAGNEGKPCAAQEGMAAP